MQAMGCYSSRRKKGILPLLTTSMGLEDTMLSDESKKRLNVLTCMRSLKKPDHSSSRWTGGYQGLVWGGDGEMQMPS